MKSMFELYRQRWKFNYFGNFYNSFDETMRNLGIEDINYVRSNVAAKFSLYDIVDPMVESEWVFNLFAEPDVVYRILPEKI